MRANKQKGNRRVPLKWRMSRVTARLPQERFFKSRVPLMAQPATLRSGNKNDQDTGGDDGNTHQNYYAASNKFRHDPLLESMCSDPSGHQRHQELKVHYTCGVERRLKPQFICCSSG